MANKDAYTRLEAAKKLRMLGVSDEEIQKLLGAKGGPKSADIDRGMIYFLAKNPNNNGEPELFLTYSKVAYQSDRQAPYNAAICLTATARDKDSMLVEAKDAVGAQSIRTADLGQPVMTLAEASKVLLGAVQAKLKASKAEAPKK